MSAAHGLREAANEMNDRTGEHGSKAFAMIERIANPERAFATKALMITQLASAELVACAILRACAAIIASNE